MLGTLYAPHGHVAIQSSVALEVWVSCIGEKPEAQGSEQTHSVSPPSSSSTVFPLMWPRVQPKKQELFKAGHLSCPPLGDRHPTQDLVFCR